MSLKSVIGALVILFAGATAHAAPITFVNSTFITITDNAQASLFPSSISTPAGIWGLYIRDDNSGDAGSLTGGWSVTLDVVGGFVTDVNVTLLGLNHNFFSDLDIMVVGPNGIGVALTTDNGGGGRAMGGTYVFDDEAATSIVNIPVSGIVAPGAYRPEGGAGPFVAPNGTAASLAAFDGLAFNDATSVPEPSTLSLVLLGVSGVGVRVFRGARRQK